MSDEMKTCPYCFEEIKVEATRCRYCRSYLLNTVRIAEWHRDLPGRRWLGVAEALGTNTPVPAIAWRILFVLFSFIHGIGLVSYLILWSLLPYHRNGRAFADRIIRAFRHGAAALKNNDVTGVEQA